MSKNIEMKERQSDGTYEKLIPSVIAQDNSCYLTSVTAQKYGLNENSVPNDAFEKLSKSLSYHSHVFEKGKALTTFNPGTLLEIDGKYFYLVTHSYENELNPAAHTLLMELNPRLRQPLSSTATSNFINSSLCSYLNNDYYKSLPKVFRDNLQPTKFRCYENSGEKIYQARVFLPSLAEMSDSVALGPQYPVSGGPFEFSNYDMLLGNSYNIMRGNSLWSRDLIWDSQWNATQGYYYYVNPAEVQIYKGSLTNSYMFQPMFSVNGSTLIYASDPVNIITDVKSNILGTANYILEGEYNGTGSWPLQITFGFKPQILIIEDAFLGIAGVNTNLNPARNYQLEYNIEWYNDKVIIKSNNGRNEINYINRAGERIKYVVIGRK